MRKLILSLVVFTTPLLSHAAGFGLAEVSGSGLGNAFAGGAAVAEDASSIYANPASMTYVEGSQAVGALHLIKPNAEFNNGGLSVPGAGRPLGGEGGDAGDLAFVPNMYFKVDLSDSLKFGIGVNAPFGLKTEYDKTWLGRFQGIKSDLKTININPSLAIKLNEQLSIGAGRHAWPPATWGRRRRATPSRVQWPLPGGPPRQSGRWCPPHRPPNGRGREWGGGVWRGSWQRGGKCGVAAILPCNPVAWYKVTGFQPRGGRELSRTMSSGPGSLALGLPPRSISSMAVAASLPIS